MSAAQVELSKKRDMELAKLRREMEEASLAHENQLGQLRKKHNDAVAELGDQLDQLSKHKAKSVSRPCNTVFHELLLILHIASFVTKPVTG